MTTEASPLMSRTSHWVVRLRVDALVAIEPEVQSFLEGNEVDVRASYVATAVIEEIVRNLIEHTPPFAADEYAAVAIEVHPSLVRVIIEDTRPAFDPFDGPTLDVESPLDQRRPGGMGLHLIRQLTDELRYERDGTRNRLIAAVGRS